MATLHDTSRAQALHRSKHSPQKLLAQSEKEPQKDSEPQGQSTGAADAPPALPAEQPASSAGGNDASDDVIQSAVRGHCDTPSCCVPGRRSPGRCNDCSFDLTGWCARHDMRLQGAPVPCADFCNAARFVEYVYKV